MIRFGFTCAIVISIPLLGAFGCSSDDETGQTNPAAGGAGRGGSAGSGGSSHSGAATGTGGTCNIGALGCLCTAAGTCDLPNQCDPNLKICVTGNTGVGGSFGVGGGASGNPGVTTAGAGTAAGGTASGGTGTAGVAGDVRGGSPNSGGTPTTVAGGAPGTGGASGAGTAGAQAGSVAAGAGMTSIAGTTGIAGADAIDGPNVDGAGPGASVPTEGPGGIATCSAATTDIDVPWVSQKLSTLEWSGNVCCGPAVTTMVKGYVDGLTQLTETHLKQTIDWMATNVTGWLPRSYACSTTDSDVVVDVLTRYANVVAKDATIEWCDLAGYLDQNHIVIIHASSQMSNGTQTFTNSGASHWVILDRVNGAFTSVNDPGRGAASNGDHRIYTTSSVRASYEQRGKLAIIVTLTADVCGGCSQHGNCVNSACVCTGSFDGVACDRCDPGFTGYPDCQPCGAQGQACCAGTTQCSGSLICQTGTCQACVPNCTGKCGGAADGCGGTCQSCPSGNNCTSQTCSACGASGQACCSSGTQCQGSLACLSGSCGTCTPAWTCSWSSCLGGSESASSCMDSNACGSSTGMPTTRTCPTRTRIRRLYGSNGYGCGNPSADWDHCPSTNGTTCLVGQNSSWTYSADASTVDFWVYPLGAFGAGDPDITTAFEYPLVRLDACYNASTTRHLLEPTDRLKAINVEANTANAATGTSGWTCQKAGYVRTGSKVTTDSYMISIYRNEATDSKSTTFYQPTNGTDAACAISGSESWYAWNAQ